MFGGSKKKCSGGHQILYIYFPRGDNKKPLLNHGHWRSEESLWISSTDSDSFLRNIYCFDYSPAWTAINLKRTQKMIMFLPDGMKTMATSVVAQPYSFQQPECSTQRDSFLRSCVTRYDAESLPTLKLVSQVSKFKRSNVQAFQVVLRVRLAHIFKKVSSSLQSSLVDLLASLRI